MRRSLRSGVSRLEKVHLGETVRREAKALTSNQKPQGTRADGGEKEPDTVYAV